MKKVLRIVISIMLVLCMVLPVSAFSTIAIKSVKLDKTNLTMMVGDYYKLNVTIAPSNTSQKILKYNTTNANIASIDSTGNISAVGKGKATISVTSTANSKVTAKCSVTVNLPPATKIVWYYNMSQVQVPENGYIVKQIKKVLNIDFVHVKPSSSDYEERLSLMLAGREEVDIVGCVTTDLKNKLISQGVIQPLDYYINNKYIPNVIRISSNWSKGLATTKAGDGKFYTIPATNGETMGGSSCFIRYDWLKKLKLKVPTTFAQLKDVLVHFTKDDPDGNKLNDTYGTVLNEIWGAYNYSPNLGFQYGEWYRTTDNKVTYFQFKQKEVINWITYIADLIKSGAANNEILTTKFNDVNNLIKAGKVGFLWNYNDTIFNDNIKKTQPGVDWNLMPAPKGIFDQGYLTAATPVLNEYGITSKDKIIPALRLMNYFANDKSTATKYDFTGSFYQMRYGQRGVNWDLYKGNIDTGTHFPAIKLTNAGQTWVGMVGNFSSKFDTSWVLALDKRDLDYYKLFHKQKTTASIPDNNIDKAIDKNGIILPSKVGRFIAEYNTKFEEYFANAVMGKVNITQGYADFLAQTKAGGLDGYMDTMTKVFRDAGKIK